MGVSAPTANAEPHAALSASELTHLVQMADAYLQRRADAITAGGSRSRFASAPVAMTAAAAEDLADDLIALQRNGRALEKVSGGYVRAEVTVTPGESTVSGDTATIVATEDARLYYPNPQEGVPAYEEYSLPHTLTFTRSVEGWKLAGDRARVDPSSLQPTTQITHPIGDPGPINEPGPAGEPAPDSQDEGPKEPPSSTELPATGMSSQTAKPTLSASYSYDKMVDYANRYWKDYNGGYRSYGNDCTNFISQAMRAGGWSTTAGSPSSRADNSKWFYASYTWSTSYTWAGAENWYWFAQRHSGRTQRIANIWDMFPSDVAQVDWADPSPDGNINHTMIVTARGGGDLYMTYHSSNTHNKKLSIIRAQTSGASWYAHRT
ncbi:amidase domain-containing protein [Streptomyces sp. NPDC060010]|uniref:amidase domain-containing protein n=1 Tax=Streptomyces sp. NPDC060010 TaxID=3347036 RepID=UPI0036841872